MNAEIISKISLSLKTKYGFCKSEPIFNKHSKAFEGAIKVCGKNIDLRLEIYDLTFRCPPSIYLLNPDAQLPPNRFSVHLESNNKLCYVDRETLNLNMYKPAESVLRCVEQAKETLEKIFNNDGLEEDLVREFTSYWDGYSAFITLENLDDKSRLYFSEQNKFLPIVTNSKKFIQKYTNFDSKLIISEKKVKIIKFNQELTFPNQRFDAPKNLKNLLDWFQFLGIKDSLDNFLRNYENEVIIISAKNCVCGFSIVLPKHIENSMSKGKGGFRKPPIKNDYEIQRYKFIDLGAKNVIRRNLPNMKTLENKKISIIGCGTIGSHLAKFLVQSGAGFGDGLLNLFDIDRLMPANIGRHLLGYNYLSKNKADGCKIFLESLYPEVKIKPVSKDALNCDYILKSSDIVINATGDYEFSVALNYRAVKSRKDSKNFPWILNITLHGSGDSAQGLFVGNDNEYPCFMCLKDINDRWRFSPVDYSEDIRIPAACGDGSFMPYAVSSSAIAASLALEMLLDWVNERPKPYLRTRNIKQENTKKIKDQSSIKYDKCPACK